MSIREGCEPDEFWEALGGKSEYPKEKKTIKRMEDPHLFTLNVTDGRIITFTFPWKDNVFPALVQNILAIISFARTSLMVVVVLCWFGENSPSGDLKVHYLYYFQWTYISLVYQ